MRLENKHIVVSGGASGLGLGVVVALLQKNVARITILDREEPETVRGTVESVRTSVGSTTSTGSTTSITQFTIVKVDLTEESQIAKATQKIAHPVHGLVNCAGIGSAQRTVSRKGKEADMSTFEFVIRLNLIGNYSLASKVAALIAKSNPSTPPGEERGCIINVASVAAYEGQQGQCAYSASKAGVVGMALPMARDLAEWRIRVNTVCPGVFDTPMTAHMTPDTAVFKSLISQHCFPDRFGTRAEFGELCCHIFENAMINGESIRLDAGCRMPILPKKANL